MKNFIAVLSTLLLLAPAAAEDLQVTGIEIVEYGLYTAEISKQQDPNAGSRFVDNPKLAVRTTTVPAQLGVRFGLQYKVLGSPTGAEVTLHRVTRVPSPGLKEPGTVEPIRAVERNIIKNINQLTYSDWSFDHEYELIPGKWTIEFWYNGRKLASKDFTIVKP